MLRAIPIIIEKESNADPPLLMKGRGIPMTGLIPIVIPILIKKCIKIKPAII